MARSSLSREGPNSDVERTSLHSRYACWLMMSLARSSSRSPASSTMIRSDPLFWISGSSTP